MKNLKSALLGIGLLTAGSRDAFALNLGFVRFPDWMDIYIFSQFAITFVAWLGLWVTKPRGVAFQDLWNVRLSPLANLFHYTMAIAFIAGMILLFLGMGLTRYAEATS
ncbi:hypothetical protein [Roseibium sediminicola]|uniref:Uncharacterized protein n=1 Tax=Roseibium sediminicola TaxID=2933272 RepID=A0ABT0GZ80_9HYPH|nr:hypothetical protein [Roseibium sp. CAU 1639]MCK7614738.1 hypothetical protein [Roseibium sp. CAU 1639]